MIFAHFVYCKLLFVKCVLKIVFNANCVTWLLIILGCILLQNSYTVFKPAVIIA